MGTCLEDSQCPYGKTCKIDEEFIEANPDLAWTSLNRCQIGWRQLIEQDPVLIIIVMSLLGFALLAIIGPFCLYCDLKKISPWEALKKCATVADQSTRNHQQLKIDKYYHISAETFKKIILLLDILFLL